mgnify:CR=1 FL=1
MFDQLVAFAGKQLTYQAVTEQLHVLDHDTYFTLTDQALASDIPGAMLLFNDVMARGFDAHHFITGWANHLRNLMVSRDAQTLKLIEATDDVKAKFQDQASRADLFFLVGGLDVLNQADVQYRGSQHQRLLVELAVMQICSHEALKKKSPDEGLMPPTISEAEVVSVHEERASSPSPPPQPATPATTIESTTSPSHDVDLEHDDLGQESKSGALVEAVVARPVAVQPPAIVQAPRAAGLRKNKQNVVAPSGHIKAKPEVSDQPTESAMQIDPSWNENVSHAGVKNAWNDFVDKLRKQDRIALTATMSLGDPELDGNRIVYAVKNPLQREQMDALRTEILIHLKTALRNANMELHVEMKEQTMDEKKAFLSDKDRYELMVEKNPSLDRLRKALDLDLG